MSLWKAPLLWEWLSAVLYWSGTNLDFTNLALILNNDDSTRSFMSSTIGQLPLPYYEIRNSDINIHRNSFEVTRTHLKQRFF